MMPTDLLKVREFFKYKDIIVLLLLLVHKHNGHFTSVLPVVSACNSSPTDTLALMPIKRDALFLGSKM